MAKKTRLPETFPTEDGGPTQWIVKPLSSASNRSERTHAVEAFVLTLLILPVLVLPVLILPVLVLPVLVLPVLVLPVLVLPVLVLPVLVLPVLVLPVLVLPVLVLPVLVLPVLVPPLLVPRKLLHQLLSMKCNRKTKLSLLRTGPRNLPSILSPAGPFLAAPLPVNVAMQAGSSESLNSSGPATKRQKIVDKATSPFVAPKSFDPSSKNEEHTNQSHDLTRREGDVIVRIAPNESSDNPSVPPPYIYLNGVRYRWAPVAVENGHDSTESTGELSRAPVMETTNSIGDGVSPAIVSQDDGRRSSASSVVTAEEPSAVSTQAPPTQASNTSELVSPTYGYTNISVVQVSFTSNESRAANSEPSINSSTAISYDVTQRSDRPTQVSSISIERELNISEVNGEVSNLTGTPSFVAQSSGWPSQIFRTPTSPLLLSTPADQSQPIPCDLTVENDVSPDHIGHVSVDHGSDGLAGEPADVSSAGRPSLLSITTDNDAPISPLVTFTPIESLDIVSPPLAQSEHRAPHEIPTCPSQCRLLPPFSSQEPVHFTVMHNRENREEIGTDIAELRSPGPRRASPLNPTFGMSPTSQDNLHSVRIPFPSPVASNEPETVAENDTAEADPVTADSVDLEAGNSKD
ncbi:unnamed protein product [Caenorhabditis auriculariae]|uniref:Uncharacterized protein n=1 Tax=Caenorhabditis auriculariae TaxID=2777116 RepID=A0A8S1HAU0_9PELO|nr:unnamed protein product [Caenorhabditis auriculariae]